MFGVAVALVVRYGLRYLWLALPHFVLLVGVALLMHRRMRVLAGSIALGYLACWLLTSAVGTARLRSEVQDQLPSEFPSLSYDPVRRDYQRLRFDRNADLGPFPEPPWRYVGNGSAPCPFVVFVDYGVMGPGRIGSGGTVIGFWSIGTVWTIHAELRWEA